ncbi:hypothetical protein AB0B28_20655 [Glycomyces sp. NPDC046736]|uniref:hypothetical protein n=1 Tax=Glycomyces sp. NPDC046736 TaxID=3155615 RepID=UPI0033C8E883
MRPPINVRHEVVCAVLPLGLAAAIAAAAWLHMFAADSALTTAAFVICVLIATVGAIAVVATTFMGRLRQAMGRLTYLVPAFALLGAMVPMYALDQFALVHRGIQVQCEVVAIDNYVRGSDTLRTDHEFACPGWPSFNADTSRAERFPIGHDLIATIDPLDRAEPSIREVSSTNALIAAAFSIGLLAAVVFGRLDAVDDGRIRAAWRVRIRRLRNRGVA